MNLVCLGKKSYTSLEPIFVGQKDPAGLLSLHVALCSPVVQEEVWDVAHQPVTCQLLEPCNVKASVCGHAHGIGRRQ